MRGERNICTLLYFMPFAGSSEFVKSSNRCMITSPLQPIINMLIVSITATFRGASRHQLPSIIIIIIILHFTV